MRFVLVISAVLILLITPAAVVSNVLAQRPQPPPPPHPGEGTIVVVQLVQLVVEIEVTSQATDIIPTVLIASPAATSPLALPPSTETGLAGIDAIGLLTGSIGMLGTAVYLTRRAWTGLPTGENPHGEPPPGVDQGGSPPPPSPPASAAEGAGLGTRNMGEAERQQDGTPPVDPNAEPLSRRKGKDDLA